jgi:hypothetical protein
MNGHQEGQAALRTLRAVLERHSTPGTLAPRHRLKKPLSWAVRLKLSLTKGIASYEN